MPSRTLSESEFNTIKDRVLSSLPDNLTEEEFHRAVGPRMEAALGEAENAPPAVEGSAVGRFLSNAGEMLNPVSMVTGTYNAVRHPLDTVAGVASSMGQEWQKAAEAAKAGNYTEAAARAVTGSVPVVGPLVGGIGEQIGRGDFAGAAGKAAGLAVPFAAEEALAARAAGQAGRAGTLEREAAQQVSQRVLAPGNPAFKGTAQAIAPEILARKLTGNRLELQQAAEEGMADAGTRLDQAIQDAGGVKAPVPSTEIVSRLRSSIADLQDSSGKPLSGQAAKRIGAIQERINQIQALGGRSRLISFEDLKKIRDENYGLAKEAKVYERQGNPIKSDEGYAAGETGSAIREAFATRSPAQAAANADYTFWKNLNDILDPVKGRPKSMAPSAGITGGARTTGAVAGILTGSKTITFITSTVLPWIQERMADSSWQLADANRKMKMAQAMKRGDVGTMKTLMVKWAEGAPRATSPSESPSSEGLATGTP